MEHFFIVVCVYLFIQTAPEGALCTPVTAVCQGGSLFICNIEYALVLFPSANIGNCQDCNPGLINTQPG